VRPLPIPISRQKKIIPVHRTIRDHCLLCALKRYELPRTKSAPRLEDGTVSCISLYCSTYVVR
jgi:hypothetical protein